MCFPTRAALVFSALASICVLSPPPARGAATLEPSLAAHLETISSDELVSVILIMDEQAPIDELDRELSRTRASRRVRHARVVDALQQASRRQADLLAWLTAGWRTGRVAGYTSYWISNLVVAQVTKSFLYELVERDDLTYIEPNFRPVLIDPVGTPGHQPGAAREIGVTPGLRAINADRVWYELGFTGAGRLLANLDTGVDGSHPALADRWRGAHGHPAAECWRNSAGGFPDFPHDQREHGTHVMGTLTGLGEATMDTIGVAWNAMWIACDAIGMAVTDPEFDNEIIGAFQWFADPDGDPATVDDVPDVVQNSWGVSEMFPGYEDCDSRWWAVIDHCEAAGVVTCWSAGNEGPNPYTLRSPADRATTPCNCFSVGAVDATNAGFPYPIANFSSRGPSGCDSASVKPEVAAPGVDVYSSVPGGGYEQDGWSGTSMAGPHVAGVVALMREANPNLAVDTIKQILMETAVDHGDPGEDNDFGWGVIDAYQAVLAVMSGYGTLNGSVSNASNGGTPVAGAQVRADEAAAATSSGFDGSYAISLPAGTYTISISHPSFDPQSVAGVEIFEELTTTLDFALTDVGSPEISATTEHPTTGDLVGPYEIFTTVTDYSALDHVTLYYRTNGGSWNGLPMATAGADSFMAAIPGQSYVTQIEYYVEAADIASNSATDPPGAPEETYAFWVAPHETWLDDSLETGAPGWFHGVVTSGFVDQWHLSTQRNHTPGGTTSWKCGDTGEGNYAPLLDAGLVTPELNLGSAAVLRYWQWLEIDDYPAIPGQTYDGALVEINPEGGGWTQIFPLGGYPYLIRTAGAPGPLAEGTEVFAGTRDWHLVEFDLAEFSGNVRLRFRFGSNIVTEMEGWFIDDVVVDGFNLEFSGLPEPELHAVLILTGGDPNPFGARTQLRYTLPRECEVLLQVFDLGGRLVRTLASGVQAPGSHGTDWDGRDEAARPLPSGVYLTRLQAGSQEATTKLILSR